MTQYQEAKDYLRVIAQQAKKKHPTDRPMVRQIINDTADFLCKDYQFSEYNRNLLAKFACKLHPVS
jgi:PIN domain nuclease of toxin-antitoxin system